MKTLATLVSWLVISTSLLAQIQITSSDVEGMFAPGKIWHNYSTNNPGVMMNVGTSSSSSQTWTVPIIAYTDSSIDTNVTVSSTPYASYFPSATNAQYFTADSSGFTYTVYSYIRITSDTLESLGDALHVVGNGIDTSLIQPDVSLYVLLPATYGSSFVQSRDSIDLGGGNYDIETKTVYFDAFGSITMPNGTFSTLRQKTVDQTDVYQNGTLINSYSSKNLNWIAPDAGTFNAGIDTSAQDTGNVNLDEADLTIINSSSTGVNDNLSNMPVDYKLLQNFPNPFNPTTEISYHLPQNSYVKLEVFNILGQEVSMLVNSNQNAGKYSVTWNGRDKSGNAMPSGIYLYRIQAGNFVSVKKMMLLK